jgi:D-ribose pyranose/furanose isomerase RbsD
MAFLTITQRGVMVFADGRFAKFSVGMLPVPRVFLKLDLSVCTSIPKYIKIMQCPTQNYNLNQCSFSKAFKNILIKTKVKPCCILP